MDDPLQRALAGTHFSVDLTEPISLSLRPPDSSKRDQAILYMPSYRKPTRALARFSTGASPDKDRLAIWREEFGRQLVRLDFQLLNDRNLQFETTIYKPPTLRLALNRTNGHSASRARELLSDGNDDLMLFINLDGTSVLSQFDVETVVAPGEALFASCADTGTLHFAMPGRYLCISLARQSLVALDTNPDALIMKHVPADSRALRLLASYITTVLDGEPPSSASSEQMFVNHVYDLVRLLMGSGNNDATQNLGIRAARYAAVMREIDRHFLQPDYSLAELAREVGVTKRYVQLLLAESGASFVDEIHDRRLEHARHMLSAPEGRDFNIIDIAQQSGFSTVSHFHRMFRRRYGITPGYARPRTNGESET
jgi:AraC-like DNA-binding protein